MRRTTRRLAQLAFASGIVAFGCATPADAIMPHDPPPWAGRVDIVTVEHTVEVPASDGPRFDQLALGAATGLAIDLFWTAAARRRSTLLP
ncbi:MAG: hypothetical protein QOF10_3070 [Kribbellaceae bacterium]|nr:hypothetical protein [Kribbellaceae bacterium]